MAKISLRAYHREIESLIERGRTKDAVAHSRYILKYLPKSINTFRLLGKAYLESQRYTEGADVLQRILSAVPDDFVSQVGMSIIREDEGNLDAAIWHMERAFEAQPSNVAVQDELRRLYGRRDGVQPAKIRLTRGALVRMYARGDLYQQAIAEARMALVEQPDRVDLEMILARMYFLAGQKVSATDVATGLIEKLPFCYEANKILSETLPGTIREDEVNTYRQRLAEIDPYLPYIPEGSTSSDEAPENSVLLDYPEEPAENLEEPGQLPTWAQNLGVKWDGDEEDEKLPEWMTSVATAIPEESGLSAESISQVSDDMQAENLEKSIEEDIPTWMQEAGWQQSGSEQTPPEISEEIVDKLADDVEIPEWLQSLAPIGEADLATETPENEEDTRWLESILIDEHDGGESEIEEGESLSFSEEDLPIEGMPFTDEQAPLVQTIPSDLEGLPVEDKPAFFDENLLGDETESIPGTENVGDDVPLEDMAVDISAIESNLDVPDWLAGLAEFEKDEAAEEPGKVPLEDTGWLTEITDKVKEPTEAEAEIKEDTSWLKALLGKSDKESIEESKIPSGSEITDTPLETTSEAFSEIIQEPLEDEAPLQFDGEVSPFNESEPEFGIIEPLEPAEISENIPSLESSASQTTDDFLAEIEKSLAGDQEATKPTRLTQPSDEAVGEILPPLEEELPEDIAEFFKNNGEEPIEIDSEVPEMLQGILDMDEEFTPGEIEQSAINFEENLPEAVDVSTFDGAGEMDLPDWLKESLEKDFGQSQALSEAESSPEDELTLEEVERNSEHPLVEAAFAELAENPPGEPGEMDADSAISWLESLAAKQEISEGDLSTTPEEPGEAVFDEQLGEEVFTSELEPDSVEKAAIPEEEISFASPGESEAAIGYQAESEAVEELEPETAYEGPVEEPLEEIRMPEWLADDLTESEPSAVISDLGAFEPPSLEEIEWIKEENLDQIPVDSSEMPETGTELIETSEVTEETLETPIEEAENEFAGLDGDFKGTQVSEELETVAGLDSEPGTVEEPEEVPDWLMALADDSTNQPAAIEEPEEVLPPEWLKDLDEKVSATGDNIPDQISEPLPVSMEAPEVESVPESINVEDTSPIRVITSPVSEYVTEGSELYNAQAALNAHDIDKALSHYNNLITRGEAVDDIIHDLRDALDQFPVNVSLWQTLGDAYARNNQLQDALDAYTSAEGLLG